ncbi:MAG: hypothetical protein E6767_03525 [Dysgonomonas sp.]|nr:hypothetical protein [Dysgonomonas sp.]
MKKLVFTLICLLFFSNVNIFSQNEITLPDCLGEYLFELFANRADIDRPDINLKVQPNYNPSENWSILLKSADDHNVKTQTVTYYNTFYTSSGYIDSEPGSITYDIYVAMNIQDKIYAFNVEASLSDNKWHIINIKPILYDYINTKDKRYKFRPLTDELSVESVDNYVFNNAFNPSVDFRNITTISSIIPFVHKTAELIVNEAPYGENGVFMSEEEYLQTEGIRLQQLIGNLLKDESSLGGDMEEAINIYNNPSLLFESELVGGWRQLIIGLKNRFENRLKEYSPYKTEIEISNWNDKSGLLNNIQATISMPLSRNDHSVGIYYSAIWLCNTESDCKWKMSHIQDFTYGIN